MKLGGHFIAPLIEITLNRALRLDPNYENLLQPVIGKRLLVSLQDFPFTLIFQPTASAIKVFVNGDELADISVKGRAINLLRLGLGAEPQKLIHENLIEIDGDMLILQAFQTLMQGMDFDWQGKLASIIGDTATHAIAKPINSTKTWCQHSRQSTQKDISEYLQEEKKILPPREAVEDFFDDIAAFRDTVDRLDAKVKTLAKK